MVFICDFTIVIIFIPCAKHYDKILQNCNNVKIITAIFWQSKDDMRRSRKRRISK